jgi:hypothetical protein
MISSVKFHDIQYKETRYILSSANHFIYIVENVYVMFKNTTLSIICCLAFLCSYAQSSCDCFERLRRLAEYQYDKKDFRGAYNSLLKAFEYRDAALLTHRDEIFLAELAYKISKKDEARVHLLQAIRQGADPKEDIYSDTIFNSFYDDSFREEATRAYAVSKSRYNLQYYSAIQQLMGVDQFIRTDKFFEKVNFSQFDSVNFYKLKGLIDEHGYPNLKDHGFDHSAIMVLLLHASVLSDSMYKQVLQILENAQEKGYVGNSFIAMVIDRHRTWIDKKPQMYGNWSVVSGLPVVEDLSKIDENRYSRNLLSFATLAEMYKYQLPKEYKVRPYPHNYFCDGK